MKVAKAKGRLRGKQPKLKPNQAKHLLELHDLGTYTQGEVAELFGVGPRCTGPSSGCGSSHQNRSGHSPISRTLRREPTPADQPRRWASHRVRPASTPARHIEMSQLRNATGEGWLPGSGFGARWPCLSRLIRLMGATMAAASTRVLSGPSRLSPVARGAGQ
jgi:hypothetical protein